MAADRALDPQTEQQAREVLDGVVDLVAQLAAARSEIAHLRAAPRPLLTLSQAADFLGLSIETVRQLVNAGELPKVQLGEASPRITPEDLDAFVASRRVARGSRVARLTTLKPARRR